MIVSYKNRILRTGWDCGNTDHDRHAAWASDFEREIEIQCDKLGIDPENVGASVYDCDNIKRDPKETARQMVRKAAKRLRMI